MNGHNRTLLGKWSTLASRERVYQTPDALEVESSENYEIKVYRVFYDDVRVVTIHRYRGVLFLTLSGLFGAGLFALVAFILTRGNDAWPAAIPFSLMALPFAIAFLVRAIFGVDVITVFGRRSKATLRFRVKKQKARQVYGQICAIVRQAQRRAEPAPAEPAPPIPESP